MNIRSTIHDEDLYMGGSEFFSSISLYNQNEDKINSSNDEIIYENFMLRLQICNLNEEIALLKGQRNDVETSSLDDYDDEKYCIPTEPHARRQVKLKVTHLGNWEFPIILDEE